MITELSLILLFATFLFRILIEGLPNVGEEVVTGTTNPSLPTATMLTRRSKRKSVKNTNNVAPCTTRRPCPMTNRVSAPCSLRVAATLPSSCRPGAVCTMIARSRHPPALRLRKGGVVRVRHQAACFVGRCCSYAVSIVEGDINDGHLLAKLLDDVPPHAVGWLEQTT